jgi:hypothetical protein
MHSLHDAGDTGGAGGEQPAFLRLRLARRIGRQSPSSAMRWLGTKAMLADSASKGA